MLFEVLNAKMLNTPCCYQLSLPCGRFGRPGADLRLFSPQPAARRSEDWVRGGTSPPAPFGIHPPTAVAFPPRWYPFYRPVKDEQLGQLVGDGWYRTSDLRITNPTLYHWAIAPLSYRAKETSVHNLKKVSRKRWSFAWDMADRKKGGG